MCATFGASTLFYEKEKNSLYVTGYNGSGELGLGNKNAVKNFTHCNNP